MTKSTATIQKLAVSAQAELEEVSTPAQLESWRVQYLGRKGAVSQFLRNVKDLPEAERKQAGQQGNQLRRQLEVAFNTKEQQLAGSQKPDTKSKVDHSTSNHKSHSAPGHLHPITLSMRRLQIIMANLGFQIVTGPELEQEYYDFDALNIPLTHPARAESDSFYVAPRQPNGQGRVLRTSTSAVQVRTVVEQGLKPPFRITSPGRVFRNEKPDPTHESSFHQIEALMVDKAVTIADYKAITTTLFSAFFGSDVSIRLRPGYFPFVEPGFEVDMSCVFCTDGCRVCKGTRWLEMGGAGMVHPNVLRNMNIDPHQYQGFAFGYGIDRFTMLRHNIDDIRLFWSGNIRFLKQFS